MNRTALLIVLGIAVTLSAGSAAADLYRRAPDVIPGTTAAMHDPAYWIDRMDKPDDVVMTPGRIQEMNRRFRERMLSPDYWASVPDELASDLDHYWVGIVMVMPDLHGLPGAALVDTVRLRIGDEIGYLRSRPFGNINAIEYADWEIDRQEHEMALDMVPDAVTPRDGITVRTTRLRNVPSFFPMESGITGTGTSRHDLWNIGALGIARPVVVLHASRSGEYAFVVCEIGYGWVRAEDIAFAPREVVGDFADPDDFVVCTGDRVQLYMDSACRFASSWFRMADRLPVADSGDPRQVKLPVRRSDGSFAVETVWLRPDADVHHGWLPYTRRNVVETALKLVGNPYDFTGAWFGRQHETAYRDIFGCFGFDLPWHGGLFAHYAAGADVMQPDIGREAQYREILTHEPFLTVMTTLQDTGGHAQLLLGKRDGIPVVFDTHGYGYTDDNGDQVEVRRCIIGDVTQPSYFLKRPVTFLELK